MPTTYKVHTISLGCPKNRVDTEQLLGALPFRTTAVETPEDANLVLINTCAFINPAVEESVRAVLDAAEALRGLTPKPVLAVVGCLPARFGEELRAGLPEVDVWACRPNSISSRVAYPRPLGRRTARPRADSPARRRRMPISRSPRAATCLPLLHHPVHPGQAHEPAHRAAGGRGPKPLDQGVSELCWWPRT
jgi:hypothetical protein